MCWLPCTTIVADPFRDTEGTSAGTSSSPMVLVFPSPSCPLLLAPQHLASKLSRTTHEWSWPRTAFRPTTNAIAVTISSSVHRTDRGTWCSTFCTLPPSCGLAARRSARRARDSRGASGHPSIARAARPFSSRAPSTRRARDPGHPGKLEPSCMDLSDSMTLWACTRSKRAWRRNASKCEPHAKRAEARAQAVQTPLLCESEGLMLAGCRGSASSRAPRLAHWLRDELDVRFIDDWVCVCVRSES